MPIPIICSNCKSKFIAPDHFAATKVGCPKCHDIIEVPDLMESDSKSESESDSLEFEISEKKYKRVPLNKKQKILVISIIAFIFSVLLLSSFLLIFYWGTNSNESGNVKITVSEADVVVAKITNLIRDITLTKHEVFLAKIQITNQNPTKKYEYSSPNESRSIFDRPLAVLTDNYGNVYKQIDCGFGNHLAGSITETTTLYPNETIEDFLAFERPIENIQFLTLEIKGKAFSQSENVLINIPRSTFDKKYNNFISLVKGANDAFADKHFEKANQLFFDANSLFPLELNDVISWKEVKKSLKQADELKQQLAIRLKMEEDELELKRKENEVRTKMELEERIKEEERKKASIPISTRLREYGELLKGDDDGNIIKAALEIGKLGPQAVDAVPDLENVLKHKNYEVRKEVAIALGKIGPLANKAIPNLLLLSISSHAADEEIALKVINQICPSIEDKVNANLKALAGSNQKIRMAALMRIREFGIKAESFVYQISNYLKDLDADIRKHVVATIIAIKPKCDKIIELSLIDEDPSIRKVVKNHLIEVLPREAFIEILGKHLENRDDITRLEIATTFEQIDSENQTTIISESTKLKLSKALSDLNPKVRLKIAIIMIHNQVDLSTAIKTLTQLLSEKQNEIVLSAINSLGKVKKLPLETIHCLVDLLTKGDNSSREAANLLAKINIKDKELIPGLIRALKNSDIHDQTVTILAHQGIFSITPLVDGLDSTNIEVRLGCIKALGLIGKPAYDQAYKPITEIFRVETDPLVKSEANKTLGLIRNK